MYESGRLKAKIFQNPMPFAMSIYDNTAFGVKLYEKTQSQRIGRPCRMGIKQIGFMGRSKRQTQVKRQFVIRRPAASFAHCPRDYHQTRSFLPDEPTPVLDPILTACIEELVTELKHDYTIAIVSHNIQQAARASGITAYAYLGGQAEVDDTKTIFTKRGKKETEDYIIGKFGQA